MALMVNYVIKKCHATLWLTPSRGDIVAKPCPIPPRSPAFFSKESLRISMVYYTFESKKKLFRYAAKYKILKLEFQSGIMRSNPYFQCDNVSGGQE